MGTPDSLPGTPKSGDFPPPGTPKSEDFSIAQDSAIDTNTIEVCWQTPIDEREHLRGVKCSLSLMGDLTKIETF